MLDKASTIERRTGLQFEHPVAANTKIPRGAMVFLSAMFAVNALAAADLVCVGLCTDSADNSGGADGDVSAKVERGTFVLKNSADDPVTRADIGKLCYAVDNEFVTSVPAGKTAVGLVVDVDARGVSVTI